MSEVLSILAAAGWVWVIHRFYSDYRQRPEDERHPASLAIISALSIFIFHDLVTFVMVPGRWPMTRVFMLGAELYVVVQFWVAFRVGQKKPLVRRPVEENRS